MDAKKLLTLSHIANYSTEYIIKELGLYQSVLISTLSKNVENKDNSTLLKISPDVEALYSLINLNAPLFLPCSYCKKELAFSKADNEKHNTKSNKVILNNPDSSTATKGYSSLPNNYSLYSDVLLILNGKTDAKEAAIDSSCIDCKNKIATSLPFFSIGLSCSLEQSHTIQCFFSIEPFQIDDKTKDIALAYKKLKLIAELEGNALPEITPEIESALELTKLAEYTLVIKKIGQYPSMADMQFFDLQKYRKILKKDYTELTKAVGLNASGIGVGAFIYLRRIFENLCENVHNECKILDGWHEDEYNTKRFNDKIEYLELFGKTILPLEMAGIKKKLYGVISKGVHEYSEEECFEMFPHVLLAIELMLDHKIQEQERLEKIKKMKDAISNATS